MDSGKLVLTSQRLCIMMIHKMLKRHKDTGSHRLQPTRLAGFTIVELLIVIVVIGILATITVIAFRGIQQRATSTSYVSSMDHWEKVMRTEYVATGRLPTTVTYTCLGSAASNFPANSEMIAGSCGQLVDEHAAVHNFMYDQSFTDQFQMKSNFKNGALPQMKRQPLPANGSVIMRGVMAHISVLAGGYRVDLVWYPDKKDACGRGTDEWLLNDTVAGGGCALRIDFE